MKYLTGFFGGLVSIMMAIIPVTILWSLLTGEVIFGMDIIGNFMAMVTALGNAGFVGLVAVSKLKGQLMDNIGMEWETEHGSLHLTLKSISWILKNVKMQLINHLLSIYLYWRN